MLIAWLALTQLHTCMWKRSSTLVYQIHNYYTSTHAYAHNFTCVSFTILQYVCACTAHSPSLPYDLHLFFAITYHPYLNTIKSFTYFVHFDVPSLVYGPIWRSMVMAVVVMLSSWCGCRCCQLRNFLQIYNQLKWCKQIAHVLPRPKHTHTRNQFKSLWIDSYLRIIIYTHYTHVHEWIRYDVK